MYSRTIDIYTKRPTNRFVVASNCNVRHGVITKLRLAAVGPPTVHKRAKMRSCPGSNRGCWKEIASSKSKVLTATLHNLLRKLLMLRLSPASSGTVLLTSGLNNKKKARFGSIYLVPRGFEAPSNISPYYGPSLRGFHAKHT